MFVIITKTIQFYDWVTKQTIKVESDTMLKAESKDGAIMASYGLLQFELLDGEYIKLNTVTLPYYDC